jgi:hypothetical protein
MILSPTWYFIELLLTLQHPAMPGDCRMYR